MELIRRVIAKVQQLLVCGETGLRSGIVHARSGVVIYMWKGGG